MNQSSKRNAKENKQKLMVRIICLVIVVALVVTSGIAMIASFFQDDSNGYMTAEELQAYIDAGLISIDENGYYVINDISIGSDTDVEDGHVHTEDEAVQDEAAVGETAVTEPAEGEPAAE